MESSWGEKSAKAERPTVALSEEKVIFLRSSLNFARRGSLDIWDLKGPQFQLRL